MDGNHGAERYETVIIGGGQAGLATGYHLAKARPVVRDPRGGPADRRRLAQALGLTAPVHTGPPRRAAGLEVPGQGLVVPEPGRHGRLPGGLRRPLRPAGPHRHARGRDHRRRRRGYVVTANGHRFEADNVVVATGAYQAPTVPAFASQLDPGIVQLHSSEYRGPSQLRDGGVLVVGAGNSGAEIAIESAGEHQVWLSGREVGAHPLPHGRPAVAAAAGAAGPAGHVPPGADGADADGPEDAGADGLAGGTPLIRIRPRRSPPPASSGWPGSPASGTGCRCWRTAACSRWPTSSGAPGSTTTSRGSTSPAWATASRPTERGVVDGQPGLYLVGLHFLYAMSSAMIQGAGRDAEYIARHIAARVPSARPTKEPVGA